MLVDIVELLFWHRLICVKGHKDLSMHSLISKVKKAWQMIEGFHLFVNSGVLAILVPNFFFLFISQLSQRYVEFCISQNKLILMFNSREFFLSYMIVINDSNGEKKLSFLPTIFVWKTSQIFWRKPDFDHTHSLYCVKSCDKSSDTVYLLWKVCYVKKCKCSNGQFFHPYRDV